MMRWRSGLLLLRLCAPAVAVVSRFSSFASPKFEVAWAEHQKKVLASIQTLGYLELGHLKPRLADQDTWNQTVIVTHAGKNHQEYIDMTIMLGRGLEKFAPNVTRIAIVETGSKMENQVLLRKAGWHTLKVEELQMCSPDNPGCADHFKFRWKDSFEKFHAFRMPFKKVLFLDADTYVFNSGILDLLNVEVPEGKIGLAPDGCKLNSLGTTEYNSGVMLFKPSHEMFIRLASLSATRSGDDMLDQNVINDYFQGNVHELDKKYDCIDPIGIPPGLRHQCKAEHICKKNEVVISHFTGMFKPTKANPHYLRHVQQFEGIKETCENTNHGGCQKWAEYYCAMDKNRKFLTGHLQEAMAVVGGCCLGPGHDRPECSFKTSFNNVTDGCPASVNFSTRDPEKSWMSEYHLTSATPTELQEYRPIYQNAAGTYMFYISAKRNWVVGPRYDTDLGYSYAHTDALCPHDANHWKVVNGHQLWQSSQSMHLRAGRDACPTSLRVMEGEAFPAKASRAWTGTYTIGEGMSTGMHGGKPVYKRVAEGTSDEPMFMYFLEAKTQWVIGRTWNEYSEGVAFVRGDAFCPKESLQWEIRQLKEAAPRVKAQLLILDEKRLSAKSM